MAAQKPVSAFAGVSPLSIARMLWKKRLQIVLIWGAVSIAAYFGVKRIPSVYRAEATILVNIQQIPDRYVSSTVVSDVQDRLTIISEEILSTPRLAKIIDDFDLYREERRTHHLEEIVTKMRTQDIELTPERSTTGRTTAFRVAFKGPDPIVVSRIANKLASLYVEENLRTRESQAEGTADFIESKLKEAKQRLDEEEAAVSQYQLRHNGELPQQEPALNGVLSRLGTALEANRDAINRAQQQKVMLQDALTVTEDSLATQKKELDLSANSSASGLPVPAANVPKPHKRSADLESQLAELRLRYSDNHPEVRRLRALIQQAKQEEEMSAREASRIAAAVAATRASAPAPHQPKPALDSPQLQQTRERVASLKDEIEANDHELNARQKDQQRILSDISMYQSRVNSMPIRQQEMEALTRDYEISKANYRSLLDKKIAAEMATDMERREKSERFTIIDPARIPTKPFKPDRMLLRLGGSLLGLAFGIALGLGREFQEASLLGEWELPADVSVLGRLPRIEIDQPTSLGTATGKGRTQRPKRRWKVAVVSSAVLLAGFIVAVFYVSAHRF